MFEGQPRVGVLLGASQNASPNLRGLGEMMPHFGMELLPSHLTLTDPNRIQHVDFLVSVVPSTDPMDGVLLGLAIGNKIPVMLVADHDVYPRSSLFEGKPVMGVDYFAGRDLSNTVRQFALWLEGIEEERGATVKSERLFVNGGLVIDYGMHQISVDGQVVLATPTEYKLTDCLARHADTVVEAGTILREVWGEPYVGEAHLLRVNVARTRGKLGETAANPKYFITHPGVGYRMPLQETA